MYKKIVALKEQNPDLKVMLAVGGWNHGAEPFTKMVSTEQSRNEFAENSLAFMKKYGFDGLDLGISAFFSAKKEQRKKKTEIISDWEYPAARGSPPEDRERFTKLVQVIFLCIENFKSKNFFFCLAIE